MKRLQFRQEMIAVKYQSKEDLNDMAKAKSINV